MGLLGAASFFVLRNSPNTISKSSFPQTLPISRPTIDFSNPLPFKTIEQQRKEFTQEFITEIRTSPRIGDEASRKAIIKRFTDKGFTINRLIQTTNRRGQLKVIPDIIEFIKKTPTNTFKPSLTKI